MDEKINGTDASRAANEEKETDVFQTFIIEDIKYKTRLNKKFLSRKPYQPIDPKKISSFIPGTIVSVFTKKGKKVRAGEKLLELEAMKMVNTIFADFDAIVLDVYVKPGESVAKNQLLIQFK